jgi:hypothetical protein
MEKKIEREVRNVRERQIDRKVESVGNSKME